MRLTAHHSSAYARATPGRRRRGTAEPASVSSKTSVDPAKPVELRAGGDREAHQPGEPAEHGRHRQEPPQPGLVREQAHDGVEEE